MFGIPVLTLLKFAAIAILIAVLAGMVYAAYQHIVDKGRKEIREEYGSLINKCDDSKRKPAECAAEWTTAIEANLTLQADVAKLSQASAACSEGVKKGAALTVQAQLEKDRRLAIAETRLAGIQANNAALERQLAEAAGSKTCEQTLTAVATGLRDLAKQRIRFALGFEAAPPAEPGTVRVAP